MSPLDIALAFGGGALSFLSPCVLPVVPAYLSLASGADLADLRAATAREAAARTLPGALCFVAGFSFVFVALGLAAAAAAGFLTTARPALELFAGMALLLFGLHMTDLLRLPFLDRTLSFAAPAADAQATRARRLSFAFVAGIAFGGAWTPCIGPILAGILALAASAATPWAGGALLSVYALGLGLPFLLAAAGTRVFLRAAKRLNARARVIEIVAGSILAATGLLVATGQLTELANLLARWAPWLGALG